MCLRSRAYKPHISTRDPINRSGHSFPINSVSISGRLEGLAILLECEYSYTNTLIKEGVEVEFVFPVPSGATVCGLSGEIDGRQVKGVVKEKESARQEYDDAISSGYSVGFIEKGEKDFKILLGNLSPGGKAVLKIKILSELHLNVEGLVCLQLPAAMIPQCKFNFELLIEKRVGEFSRIESSTHNISYSKELTGEVVKIKEAPQTQEKDLEILLKPSFTDLPHISIFAPITATASHRYLASHMCMLTFIPQLAAEAVATPPTAEFIFIIDRSGSMSGTRIKHAKSTLELLVQSLTIGCYFNIIGFGAMFEMLSEGQSLEYSQESQEKALHYVRKMEADFGGTYLLSPLRAAVQFPEPKPNISRQIMILTDGDTDETNEIIKMVRSTPQTFRVFSFGIGSEASPKLIEGVASAGRGKAVYLKEASEMEQKVLHIMNLAFSPDLRDIQLEFSHPTQYFPAKLPNLFLNERLVVYGFISAPSPPDGDLEARLSFTKEKERVVMKKEFSLAPDSVLTSPDDISLIHLLGCSLALNSWESELGMRSECVQLSCATGILCKHTAYIAVDSEQSAVISAPLVRIPAPVSSVITKKRKRIDTNQYRTKETRIARSRVKKYRSVLPDLDRSRSRSRSPPKFQFQSFLRGSKSEENMFNSNQNSCKSEEEDYTIANLVCMPSNDSDDDSDDDSDGCISPLFMEKSAKRKRSGNINDNESRSAEISTCKTLDSYQSITRLQRADGSWQYSEELEKELKLDLSGTCPPGVDRTVWTSIVCIVCLKVKFSQFQTQLLLVVRKGENWAKQELAKSAQKFSYEELTDTARQVLP